LAQDVKDKMVGVAKKVVAQLFSMTLDDSSMSSVVGAIKDVASS
jgi:hypothetical protein